jgi:hypothetical protein
MYFMVGFGLFYRNIKPKHPTVYERSEVSPAWAIVGGDGGGDGNAVVASVIKVADGLTKTNKNFVAASPLETQ